mmetsp:Transcript_24158/g.37117  ORF Transcript_24158/g.37117 Transcript_24158/m.37117 type:complete len:94 (+) Transcript_24158:246-527(+)
MINFLFTNHLRISQSKKLRLTRAIRKKSSMQLKNPHNQSLRQSQKKNLSLILLLKLSQNLSNKNNPNLSSKRSYLLLRRNLQFSKSLTPQAKQ